MTVAGESEALAQGRVALRLVLSSGPCAIPLGRVHHLVGYATLKGEPEEYFLGWLTLHGEQVPVFDLNRVACEEPAPEQFGTRIIVVAGGKDSPTRYIGLLAAGVTDTVQPGEVETLNLEMYLPMLCTMIPAGIQPPLGDA
jgi:chemotaxis signal transduction protein